MFLNQGMKASGPVKVSVELERRAIYSCQREQTDSGEYINTVWVHCQPRKEIDSRSHESRVERQSSAREGEYRDKRSSSDCTEEKYD